MSEVFYGGGDPPKKVRGRVPVTMSKPQLARWRSRVEKAEEQIDFARERLESTFELVDEHRHAHADETRDEECERIAAGCVRDALGCLEGAKTILSAATAHMDWDREEKARVFPVLARAFLQQCAEGVYTVPPNVLAKVREILK